REGVVLVDQGDANLVGDRVREPARQLQPAEAGSEDHDVLHAAPTLRSLRGALGSMAPMARTGEAAGALQQGRDAYAARAWGDAYALLRRADDLEALAPPDLGLLAT